MIHETLYQVENFNEVEFSGYVKNLVSSILSNFVRPGEKIDTEVIIDKVALEIHLAIPCGLILNELITNSIKHAFHDSGKGIVRSLIFCP